MPDNQSDHDLLLDLKGDVKVLRADVAEIKDNTKQTLNDHERRIRTLEQWFWKAFGALMFLQIVAALWYYYHASH